MRFNAIFCVLVSVSNGGCRARPAATIAQPFPASAISGCRLKSLMFECTPGHGRIVIRAQCQRAFDELQSVLARTAPGKTRSSHALPQYSWYEREIRTTVLLKALKPESTGTEFTLELNIDGYANAISRSVDFAAMLGPKTLERMNLLYDAGRLPRSFAFTSTLSRTELVSAMEQDGRFQAVNNGGVEYATGFIFRTPGWGVAIWVNEGGSVGGSRSGDTLIEFTIMSSEDEGLEHLTRTADPPR